MLIKKLVNIYEAFLLIFKFKSNFITIYDYFTSAITKKVVI